MMATYYHGTLDIFLDSIGQHGLLASPEFRVLSGQLIPGRQARTDAVWVTDSESSAWKWAYQAAEFYQEEYGDEARPVVLKIELPPGCDIEPDVLLDEGREIPVPYSYRIFGCHTIPPERLQVKTSPRSRFKPLQRLQPEISTFRRAGRDVRVHGHRRRA
jgi:hypothetical protein